MKKIIIRTITVAAILFAGVAGYLAYKHVSAQTVINQVTVAKPLSRLEQTKKLVDDLAEQRKKDQSFIDETNKQIESLKRQREAQARIDALMIVKTQLDVEISDLEKSK